MVGSILQFRKRPRAAGWEPPVVSAVAAGASAGCDRCGAVHRTHGTRGAAIPGDCARAGVNRWLVEEPASEPRPVFSLCRDDGAVRIGTLAIRRRQQGEQKLSAEAKRTATGAHGVGAEYAAGGRWESRSALADGARMARASAGRPGSGLHGVFIDAYSQRAVARHPSSLAILSRKSMVQLQAGELLVARSFTQPGNSLLARA